MKLIDKYYRYIRPFRFLYGGVKDTVSHAQSSKRAEEWKAKGYQGAKLDVCGGRNPFNRNEFLNVDVVDFPQVDLVFDVTKRFPIPDKVIPVPALFCWPPSTGIPEWPDGLSTGCTRCICRPWLFLLRKKSNPG